GLTGRLRSKADQEQDQERLASHRGYAWCWSQLLLQQQQIHKLLRSQTLASHRFNPPFFRNPQATGICLPLARLLRKPL
ncbi:hypothetical protein, partial [Pseudomonas sp. Pse35]|uniref:hypothetical protein n=1 Tax=Pseudomonas sp. Pse35 TaxID=2926021 RepID=UPI0021C6891A